MRYIITLLFAALFASISYGNEGGGFGLGSDTIVLTANIKKGFPTIGLDNSGNKYFILLPKQEKILLTKLYQSLYTDSILQKTVELEEASKKMIEQHKLNVTSLNVKISELQQSNTDLKKINALEVQKNWSLKIALDAQKEENKQLLRDVRFNRVLAIGGMTLGLGGIIFGIVQEAQN